MKLIAGAVRRRSVVAGVAVFIAIASAAASGQQTYPNRPLRIVAPFATSGGGDISARLFGQKLSESLGVQVVIDNRPGAGGIVGADLVAKSSPDGYTLMLVSMAHAVLPALHKKLPYDIVKDFAPVTMMVAFPHLLLVHPSVPATSVKELIALAKAKPGQINYASGGNGSSAHLDAELFKSLAGVNLVHIPYNGAGPALTGLLAGEAGMAFYSVSAAGQHVKAGRLHALAVTGAKRTASQPNLPTVAEAGLPGYEATTWTGVLAPAGTPRPIVMKLHGEFTRMLKLPDVKDRLAFLDFEPVGSTPEEFGAFIKSELAKWGKVVRDSGAKVD